MAAVRTRPCTIQNLNIQHRTHTVHAIPYFAISSACPSINKPCIFPVSLRPLAALQILLRRTKNNPVLIGDPGVGKTAVVEGIAQLAVSPLAPLALQGRCIVALDVGAMVAGENRTAMHCMGGGCMHERLSASCIEIQTKPVDRLSLIDIDKYDYCQDKKGVQA